MDILEREVRFDKYCSTCRYKDTAEHMDPCNECLDYAFNINTDKPRKYDVDPKFAKKA